MRHFSLALAGVVAGSLALSAQATTTTNVWWSENFDTSNSYYDPNYDGLYALTNSTYSALLKGVWTLGEGDASSIYAGSYSNGCSDVLNLNTEGTDLTFAPAAYAGAEMAATNKVVVDADVFFVGSDSEPSNLDSDVQFALFLKVPEEVTPASSNAVMVYVRDTNEDAPVWVELAETDGVEDKTWHHVVVKIDYGLQTKVAEVYIDGALKGSDLVLANNADSAEGLTSVSFRGTGAVDNFVGAFEVEAAAVTHTFTAAAYTNGVLASVGIQPAEGAQGANGETVMFAFPTNVDSAVVSRIVVKGLEGASDVEYTAADSFSGLTISESEGFYVVEVEISGASDVTATTYPLLEVYYASSVPPAELTGFSKYLGEQAVGDGSVANPWQIPNLAALKALQLAVATEPELGASNYVQTADIALDAPWPGIGVGAAKDLVNGNNKDIPAFEAGAFSGTYDGGNHTISNFQMANGCDYGALFNSANNATIKNLKISWGASTLTPGSSGDTGATFVGVARGSTLQNLTTLAGTVTTVTAAKDMGGIVGYLMAGSTVESCTNQINVASSGSGRKCGGIAIITQEGVGTATIRNCYNSGTVTAANTGAFVGYIGTNGTGADANETVIDGCENTAAVKLVHYQAGAVSATGVNKSNATVLSNDKSGGVSGLNFATVSGDVATFVADNALAAGNTYKVMSSGVTATYEFTAPGTITFDTALATPTYAVTAPGLVLSDSTSGTEKTYTARAKAVVEVSVRGGANATAAWTVNGVSTNAPATLTEGDTYEVVYTADPGYEFAAGAVTNASGTAGTENIEITISDAVASAPSVVEIAPEDLGATAYASQADAQAAAAGVTVGASAAVVAALDSTELAAYKAMFEIKPVQDNGEWKLTAALTDTAEAALTTEATDDAGDLVTAGFTGNVEIDATPGFYYSIVWGTGVTNLGNETTRVLAEGEKVTLPMPANSANSGFYKVKISVKPE